eukprot:31401-Pelagococcus_subviridis.AAC.4
MTPRLRLRSLLVVVVVPSEGHSIQAKVGRGVGGETRRAKSLRNDVHHADAVVWGPVWDAPDSSAAPSRLSFFSFFSLDSFSFSSRHRGAPPKLATGARFRVASNLTGSTASRRARAASSAAASDASKSG